jgi:hypothetical protein
MSKSLVQLIHRAATISQPYNCQDAVLLVKSLSSLRVSRPEVRAICEKACFSLASSPGEVDAPVVVDVVNHLSMLQSSHLPVVLKMLVKRFCELPLHSSRDSAASPVDPRTAQKAALALAKLGRCSSSSPPSSSPQSAAVEHVLRLLHVLLRQYPHDAGLHIAYIALYTCSFRYSARPQWWLAPLPHQPSLTTLASSLRYVLEHTHLYQCASGSVAWQLLHVLVVLPPSFGGGSEAGGISRQLIADYEAYYSTGALARAVSGGAYATFLQMFCGDICKTNPGRACLLLNGVLLPDKSADDGSGSSSMRRMNVYEVTKVASAVAQTLSALTATLQYASLASDVGGLQTAAQGAACGDEVAAAVTAAALLPFSSSSSELWQKKNADPSAEAVRLSCCILDHIVFSEQQRLLSHSATVSVSTTFSEEPASPDNLLVASLLHAYAKATRFTAAIPLAGQGVSALLSVVPQLSATAPSLLSWMLMSLAAIATDNKVRRSTAFTSGANVLLRRYLHFSHNKRSMRTDAEALYGGARITACSAARPDKRVRAKGTFDSTLPVTQAATASHAGATEGVTECTNRLEHAEEDRETVIPTPPFFLRGLALLMQDCARRLRCAAENKAGAVQREDLEVLLVALLDLYLSVVDIVVEGGEAAGGGSLQNALDDFQKSLLDCLERQHDDLQDAPDSATLCTVRLSLLLNLIMNSVFASGAFAARLSVMQSKRLQHLQHPTSAGLVTSATMLRCLSLLQRVQPAATAASTSGTLLCALCSSYQEYLNQCTQTLSHPSATLDDVVRVIWRARHAGVQICFEGSAAPVMSERHSVQAEEMPTLHIPLQLCRREALTARTATDLLQLLLDVPADTLDTGDEERQRVAYQTAAFLLTHLQRTPDANCMVRLLQLSASPAATQLLFSNKDDLARVLRCTEVNVSTLLASLEGPTQMDGPLDTGVQHASRLLAAATNSPLLYKIPLSTSHECRGLRDGLLRLAQHVEGHSRRVDAAPLLKIRLLCEGVL